MANMMKALLLIKLWNCICLTLIYDKFYLLKSREMMPEHLESGCSPVSICLGDAVIHVNEDASSCLLHMVIEAVRDAE